jgi:hypothetical protein
MMLKTRYYIGADTRQSVSRRAGSCGKLKLGSRGLKELIGHRILDTVAAHALFAGVS